MKTSLAASSFAAVLLASSVSSAAIVQYKATIDGAQEVPATDSTSTGVADLEFDDVAKTLRGTIELSLAEGTEVNNQHIHQAKCGESGSILKPLTPPGLNGVIAIDPPLTFDESGVKALENGELYINIHTAKHAGGEIRGQIYKADSTETCPAAAGGSDAGAGDGGAPGGGSSSGDADAGAPPPGDDGGDDGGCSTAGGAAASNGIVLGAGIALVLGALSRRKRARS